MVKAPRQIKYVLCFLSLILAYSPVMKAQITPQVSWNFNSRSSVLENGTPTELNNLQTQYDIVTESGVSFIRVKPEAETGFLRLKQSLPDNFTLSCWFRLPEGAYTENMRLFWTQDNSMIFRLSNSQMSFQTRTKDGAGGYLKDNWLIPFDGSDVESFSRLMDSQWHHLTLHYDSRKGEKKVSIDGRQPTAWSKKVERKGRICGATPCNSSLQYNHSRRTDQIFEGDLARIEIYGQSLDAEQTEAIFKSQVAFYNGRSTTPVRSRNLSEAPAFDEREFVLTSSGRTPSASDQLTSFPLPRYLPGHSLLPNFNWIDPVYMAGFGISDRNASTSAARMVSMSEELWTRWHYTLTIPANLGYKLKNGQRDEHIKALITLANRYPELPLSMITIWGNVQPAKLGGQASGPNIRQRELSPDLYLQQSNGRFIKTNGTISKTQAVFRPTAPKSLWQEDGANQKLLCDVILDQLTRPVDFVNENGEVQPFPMSADILKKDPVVVADFEASGVTSWEEYASIWKTNMRSAYRDGFINHPKLRSAHFSWYAVDGGPYTLDRFEWATARKAMLPLNGQYYSTPNFYVRTPDNWEKWKGPWRGWEWISISRKVEIAAGDELFSPFVAAGWDKNPEINVRPSQWLGLLKCLGVVGAEFYYPAVFNQNTIDQFPIPENYIWQAAMPSYAQAITSRYEEILRNGSLLVDRAGQPITEFACSDPRILFTARKHRAKKEYVLSGTIQPISNTPGNVPDQAIAKVTVDGMNLKVPVRRQGSVYHLDMERPSQPVIRQLDTWHETGHPSWWREDFFFEAEVPDFVQDCQFETEGVNELDFTNFTTFVKPNGEDPCVKYHFTPRETATFKLNVQARSLRGQGKIQVMIDDQVVGEITISQGSRWQQFTLSNSRLNRLSPTEHILSLHLSGESLALDTIQLLKQ